MKQKDERLKKMLLKISAAILEQEGFYALQISSLAQRISVEPSKIQACFPAEYELQIEAMRYAAQVWCDRTLSACECIHEKNQKIRYIIEAFAFGTEFYAGSLSCYIEAWNLIRQMPSADPSADRRLINGLKDIYKMYVRLFMTLLDPPREKQSIVQAAAWLMVISSDGFHIQNLLDNRDIQKEQTVNVLYRMLENELINE